jgi:dephospho-CoA kinase
MLKIGITGGIASGKTTVCLLFEKLYQVPIYFADVRAKHIIEEDISVKNKIIELFGEGAYIKNQYNKSYIASKVFKDKSLLQQLNQIVHPVVLADAQAFFIQHQHEKYILYESAIMFESKSYLLMDKIILVTAPLELRIERAIKRDQISKEEVLQRVQNQMTEDEKIKQSDFVITNDGKKNLETQIRTIHQQILISSN